jgi:peptide/nickel transport system substrate-binding protein
MRYSTAGAAALIIAAAVQPALAQKAKDTIRIGFYEPVRLIDEFYEAGPEGTVAARMVFDNLVNFDATKKEYVSGVASSWKQVDPRTMEFKIREDIKFTDGQPLTIDDVMYSFQFMMDPKAKYRFQDTRIGWLESYEKVDDHTLRLRGKEPMAVMLGKLTSFPPIVPQHVHAKLANWSIFGQHPVGSGPYTATEVNDQTGITLVRNPDYKHGNPGKPAGQIGTIRIAPVPEAQTQVARLLRGEQDLMHRVDRDVAENFAKNPEFQVHAEDSVSFNFIMFDAKARSGVKYFQDKRVRQALMHAVDMSQIVKLAHPDVAKLGPLPSVCSPLLPFCAADAKYPEYDPEKAKKLLAEAGYPDGFDIPILTWGEGKEAAEAVAGMWRKVGVKASVNSQTFATFIKSRIDGVPAIVTLWDNSVGQPDIDNTAEYYFLPNARNYNKDPALEKLALEGRAELDPKKRAAIYNKMFSLSNSEAYLMPLNRLPGVVVARKEVKLIGGHIHPYGFELDRLAWN